MLVDEPEAGLVSDGREANGAENSVVGTPRHGWAEDAKTLATTRDDVLIWPGFANDGDHALVW